MQAKNPDRGRRAVLADLEQTKRQIMSSMSASERAEAIGIVRSTSLKFGLIAAGGSVLAYLLFRYGLSLPLSDNQPDPRQAYAFVGYIAMTVGAVVAVINAVHYLRPDRVVLQTFSTQAREQRPDLIQELTDLANAKPFSAAAKTFIALGFVGATIAYFGICWYLVFNTQP